MVFQIGRGLADRRDFALLEETALRPFNRVVLSVLFGITPLPIMDGIITKHQLAPSDVPGQSKLTVTGEDLSVLMDLEYAPRMRMLLPRGELPENPAPLPVTEQSESQTVSETDLSYIKKLALENGYVFYIEPFGVPMNNIAYWGPQERRLPPQPALSVNMGPGTNVETMSFSYGELSPTRIRYYKADGSAVTVDRYARTPRLAARVPDPQKLDYLSTDGDGESDETKQARAQGLVNKSYDNVVTAEGTLDALRYGRILMPRRPVDVRGAGDSFDGTFYVKSVTHTIDVMKGQYKQKFSLSREGLGTTMPLVMP